MSYSGNSGGPAFNERGQCVGIAFQSLKVRCKLLLYRSPNFRPMQFLWLACCSLYLLLMQLAPWEAVLHGVLGMYLLLLLWVLSDCSSVGAGHVR